jgi:hypothetical protein
MTLAAQVGRLHREAEINQRAIEFCDVAKYLALAKGSPRNAERLVEHHRIPPHLKEVLKAAVEPGSTTGWGQQLANYNLLADAFLTSLRNVGVFDALLSFTKQVPLHTQIAITTLGATAASVGQGQAKLVSKLSLANSAIQERKAVAIVVVTDELLRASGIAAKLFATELSLAVASETDSQFLAVITSGVSPTNSNGGTAIACAQDLAAALGGLNLDAQSKVFICRTRDSEAYGNTNYFDRRAGIPDDRN